MKTSLTKWLAAPSQPVIRKVILLVTMFLVLYVIGKFMPEGFDWAGLLDAAASNGWEPGPGIWHLMSVSFLGRDFLNW